MILNSNSLLKAPYGYLLMFRDDTDLEDICIVERLFSSSLVAIVSLKSPRTLTVCHFRKGTEICNYSYSNTILAVKLNRAVSYYFFKFIFAWINQYYKCKHLNTASIQTQIVIQVWTHTGCVFTSTSCICIEFVSIFFTLTNSLYKVHDRFNEIELILNRFNIRKALQCWISLWRMHASLILSSNIRGIWRIISLISEISGMSGRIVIHSQYTRYESVAYNTWHPT